MKSSTSKSHVPSSSKSRVQGEGDYDSAKKYNADTRDFIDSGRVEQAARDAAPRNADERQSMRKAEEEGRSHAKGQGKYGQDSRGKPTKQAPGKHSQGNPVPEKVPGR